MKRIVTLLFTLIVIGQNTLAQISITVNPRKRCQTIEGFGTSLSWWANMVGSWNEKKMEKAVKHLYSPNHLNLNVFRFNIAGGDNPDHINDKNGHVAKVNGQKAEMLGYRVCQDSGYNWNADKYQRNVLLTIHKEKKNAVFEAYAYSAPWWMTESKCSSGGFISTDDNLSTKFYDEYADYLIDVVRHYKETYKLDFKTIAPFYEPLSTAWKAFGSQEGCHYSTTAQTNFIRVLGPKLKASNLQTVISASDEANVKAATYSIEKYKKNKDILPMIGQINLHTYTAEYRDRLEFNTAMDSVNKTVWVSETCTTGQGLNGMLRLTQRMFNDINMLGCTAWCDAQAIDENNNQWNMLKVNNEKQTFEFTKNYFVRMNVSRFVKPGYTILEEYTDNAIMAISPNGHEVVVVVINNDIQSKTIEIDCNIYKNARLSKYYLTDELHDCSSIPVFDGGGKRLLKTLPPESISTFVIKVG